MKKELQVYLCAGWFGPNQEQSITDAENLLRGTPNIKTYFPRHDGVKLAPNELHDSNLRKKVFDDNVSHIDHADFVVVVCDGRDGYYDTGTLWECGYAMSRNIPVIAYDPAGVAHEHLCSIYKGFTAVCTDLYALEKAIIELLFVEKVFYNAIPKKILFIGPDSTQEQRDKNGDIIASVIMECHGSNFRWVDSFSNDSLYDSVDEIFTDIDYMVSVIDDRHPIVSWMMGQAYNRQIPVITYTNFDYGVNIMLLNSLLYHCKGNAELKEVMQKMKRDGIYSLPKFDDSSLRAI